MIFIFNNDRWRIGKRLLTKGFRQNALVYDRPILLHLSHQEYPKRTDVLSDTFERQDYAIAVPQDSPLRGPLNLALLRVIADDGWQTVLTRYLGDDRN